MGNSVVIETAEQLLLKSPDPIPRLRILRDVLGEPEDSRELVKAKSAILTSRWVTALATEQLEHGGWARFHSMDSKSSNKIHTTEFGVERAIDVGLTRTDPILQKSVEYLGHLLRHDLPFPEHEEPNDRWPTGRDMFVASTLAQIESDHELLKRSTRRGSRLLEGHSIPVVTAQMMSSPLTAS